MYPAIRPPSVADEVLADIVLTASETVFLPVKIKAIIHFEAHINTYPIPQTTEYFMRDKYVFFVSSSFNASTAIRGNARVTSGYVRKSKYAVAQPAIKKNVMYPSFSVSFSSKSAIRSISKSIMYMQILNESDAKDEKKNIKGREAAKENASFECPFLEKRIKETARRINCRPAFKSLTELSEVNKRMGFKTVR